MNRNEVLERLQPYEGIRPRDLTATAKVVVAENESGFAIRPTSGAHLIDIGEAGLPALYRRTGLSAALAKNVQPETLAGVATEALTSQGEHSLMINEEGVVDIADVGKYRHIPSANVLNNVERGMPDEVEYSRILNLPNQTVQLEIAGVEETPVVAGDLIRAGVTVRFSPTGLSLPVVASNTLRLICTNGMTSLVNLREFSYTGGGNGEGNGNGNGNGPLWNWLRRSVRDAYRGVAPIIERFREMEGTAISPTERAEMIEALIRQQQLPAEAADAVRARAIAEPPNTVWDVFNLGTWASSHAIPDSEARRVVRAQRALSTFAQQDVHDRICPTCRRGRGGSEHDHSNN
jgi:hypothetical protein